MRFLIPLAVAAALAGCQKPAETRIDGAWVRLAAAPGRPAGGYFALTGGAVDRTLTSVSSPSAGRIELHETMKMSGDAMGGPSAGSGAAMTMQPVSQIAVPAGGKVTFAPGGKHLMLFDVGAGVKPGDTVTLQFSFADGRPSSAKAKVIAAGDPPPAS